MELKKSHHANLHRKKMFFFSIAMVSTLLLVNTAFEWRHYDEAYIQINTKHDFFDDLIDIPPTDLVIPPVPKAQPLVLIEIKDEEIEVKIIPIDIEMSQETKIQKFTIEVIEPEIINEKIYLFVEEPAEPNGGHSAFYKYVQDKMKYPAQARRMGIEGKVFVEFVINKDGSISDVKAIKGIGAGCDEEAVRVVEGAPKWKAGKQRGVPVKQRMVLPITFRLG